jgi:hypothetical protein
MFMRSHKWNSDITKWNTTSAETMDSMFEYSNFAQDISHWDVSRVKTRRHCFVQSNMPYDGEFEPKFNVHNEWGR